MVDLASTRKFFEITVTKESSDIDLCITDRLVALDESAVLPWHMEYRAGNFETCSSFRCLKNKPRSERLRLSGSNLLIAKGGEKSVGMK